MSDYQGGCGCGHLQYQFKDEPLNQVFCYCHACQRHTGTDKWFGLWVPVDKLNFTAGEPARFTRRGDSGQDMNHLFCPQCGTTVCVEVCAGNFYTVAAGTVKGGKVFSPRMVIYRSEAPDWAVFPDGVPQYEKLPPDLAI
ncbi:MAG: GFA family protein [Gammaproteobacteria bacterium]|nr:MAG: GFA family protein [Gammaproteobacteria bacterium]